MLHQDDPQSLATLKDSPDGSEGLARNQIGVLGIVFFVVAAASPLSAALGGAPAAIGLGNGAGAPGAYLIVGAVLLIFILQNLSSQQIWLLFWQVNLPVGISLLIAAIAGALVTALIGGLRMFQLNRALTKASKADH